MRARFLCRRGLAAPEERLNRQPAQRAGGTPADELIRYLMAPPNRSQSIQPGSLPPPVIRSRFLPRGCRTPWTCSSTMLDLALEEKLDELDPLRHLRDDADPDEDGSVRIVPVQPPSVRNQCIELSFHRAPATQDDTHVPAPITINLSVDASPGCGGIAWAAGEVRPRTPHSDLVCSGCERPGLLGPIELHRVQGVTERQDRPRAGQRNRTRRTRRRSPRGSRLDNGPSVRTSLLVPLSILRATLSSNLVRSLSCSPLLDIMKRNVALNNLGDCVTVAELNWSAVPLSITDNRLMPAQ